MFYFLTEALKRRLIQELRGYWADHPRYPELANNIQGKFSFRERPQYGIIVKAGAANKVQFSAQNYIGVIKSYVSMATLPGYPGSSPEWVREDSNAIQRNGGRFPSPPGVYYCEMTEDDVFYVDPLLDVTGEVLTLTTRSEGILQSVPFAGSLRLFEAPTGRLLHLNREYVVGDDGVTIYFKDALPLTIDVTASYRVPGVPTGPWQVRPQTAFDKAIPGCVMAFGRRFRKGDRWAVIVTPTRDDAYEEYGGKWDQSVDIDIIGRDTTEQMDLSDQTAMFLWAILRPRLMDQGIDIQDVSLGGESEEVKDENADDYFYNSSLSLTVSTDWSLQVPLVSRLAAVEESLKTLPNDLAPSPFRDPFFSARFNSEKVI